VDKAWLISGLGGRQKSGQTLYTPADGSLILPGTPDFTQLPPWVVREERPASRWQKW